MCQATAAGKDTKEGIDGRTGEAERKRRERERDGGRLRGRGSRGEELKKNGETSQPKPNLTYPRVLDSCRVRPEEAINGIAYRFAREKDLPRRCSLYDNKRRYVGAVCLRGSAGQ